MSQPVENEEEREREIFNDRDWMAFYEEHQQLEQARENIEEPPSPPANSQSLPLPPVEISLDLELYANEVDDDDGTSPHEFVQNDDQVVPQWEKKD